MKSFVIAIIVFVSLAYRVHDNQNYQAGSGIENCYQAGIDGPNVVLCEQSQHRLLIVDLKSKKAVWEWRASKSNVQLEHVKWFDFPDEAKPVYGNKYILTTASGGGVALIRIADKKAVFYGYAGGNPHSAEILPDGNIVSSSSTGNFLTLFSVDTINFPDNIAVRKYSISDGHNVVWDQKRELLWAGSDHQLRAYRYNVDCSKPELRVSDSLSLPGNLHDLFPVYGEDALWLTTNSKVFRLDLASKKFYEVDAQPPKNIKSVSSGPTGFSIIMIHPQEKWWTDEVISTTGQTVFRETGLKIYKARWFIDNQFSYPEGHEIKVCR